MLLQACCYPASHKAPACRPRLREPLSWLLLIQHCSPSLLLAWVLLRVLSFGYTPPAAQVTDLLLANLHFASSTTSLH